MQKISDHYKERWIEDDLSMWFFLNQNIVVPYYGINIISPRGMITKVMQKIQVSYRSF